MTADRPTIGAVLRGHGRESGMCDEGRVLLAYEICCEAARQLTICRLEGIFDGLHHGADPRHIAIRLRRIADELDPPRMIERANAA